MKGMQNKACIIYGSPHIKGSTFKLLNNFIKFLPSFSLSWVNAYEEMVRPCIDCGFCKSHLKQCAFKDMNKIYNLLDESRLYIIASPIYNASFPAPLKSILDRLQPYYFLRQSTVQNKKAIVLLTQGSSTLDYSSEIFCQLKPILKTLGAKILGDITLKGTDDKNLDIDKFYIKSENKIRDIISKLDNII